jgi:threonine/homoserine/homoserine lactone efflux protein
MLVSMSNAVKVEPVPLNFTHIAAMARGVRGTLPIDSRTPSTNSLSSPDHVVLAGRRPMARDWQSLLTVMIPLALVITLSPLSIIPAVLVLHSPRPRPAGLSYLLGWSLALAALTAVFVGIAGLIGGFSEPPKWASWARIVIGIALIVFGVWRWFTRHRSAHSPSWMRTLTTASPARAGVTAAVLAVLNPKVVFMCAAAGLAADTAGLGLTGSWIAAACFVAVAASSVALPILAYAMSGDRLERPLSRLKEWMERHNAALVAVILLVIGLMVLYKGIHALS